MTDAEHNERQLRRGMLTGAHISDLVRRYQRSMALPPDGLWGPVTRAVLEGWSPIASPSSNPWGGRPRPRQWLGQVHGLVVHTTGSELLRKAGRAGLTPMDYAVKWYESSTGTHYVAGHDGELVQVASEHELAHGVGMREQLQAERDGWARSVTPDVARYWRPRWKHLDVDKPSNLLPAVNANAVMVHVEMPPLPARQRPSSYWFSDAQHQTVVELAADIAMRNGFSGVREWWRTGRLVGHEDISPVTRPGWDPGALRASTRFDWARVYEALGKSAK